MLQQEREQASRRLEEREKQLGRVNQKLSELLQRKDAEVVRVNEQLKQEREQASRRLEGLEQVNQQLQIVELIQSERGEQNSQTSSKRDLVYNKLKWKEGKKIPYEMARGCDAVVGGNTVYVQDGHTVKIYSYNVTTDSWFRLPNCVHESSSITVINGWLTSVGGEESNELLSLTGEGWKHRNWTVKYPPMPTKRWETTVLCTGTALIVAGGWGEAGGVPLAKVEMMNTESHQWSTAADLPQPMHGASATVCADCIYMLGGVSTQSVYTCSVGALLQSCIPSSDHNGTSSSDKTSIWRQVADLPATHSTCVSFHGRLLAVGGRDSSCRNGITTVYMYNSTSNSWDIISHMTTGRYDCFTATLPNNRLMIMGGWTDLWTFTDTVDIATAVV